MQTETPTPKHISAETSISDTATPKLLALDHTEIFLRKHNWKLFRITSFSFGFMLFLVYFCQNSFYPDFDIFGFASLLVAASILGGGIVVFVTLGFCSPGLFWHHTFFRDPIIHAHFSNTSAVTQSSEKLQHRLTTSYFFVPCTVSLAILYVCVFLLSTPASYTTGLLAGPMVIGAYWGKKLAKEYALPKWSALKFAITALITFFLTNIISLLLLITAKDLLKEQYNLLGDHIFAITLLCLFSVIFTVIARLIQVSLTHAVIVGSLLAISVMLFSQAFTRIPNNIVKLLGIGNYDVENVLLTEDACTQLSKVEAYSIDTKCRIDQAHIIWSMGDTYYFEWTHNDKVISLRMDKQAIQSFQRLVPAPQKNTD
ncbi:hypothetical protein QCD79_00250 [Pseudomonas quasicaspiana]|nr:hypothetical protein [Pseudomonas quasicaspiana]